MTGETAVPSRRHTSNCERRNEKPVPFPACSHPGRALAPPPQSQQPVHYRNYLTPFDPRIAPGGPEDRSTINSTPPGNAKDCHHSDWRRNCAFSGLFN